MTLLQQFLLIALLPAGFIALAIYSWRASLAPNRLTYRWLLALLTAAVWSSSLMRLYLGRDVPDVVPYIWSLLGLHALSLLPFWLLLATASQLKMMPARSRIAGGHALFLWLAGLILNPAIWPFSQPTFRLLGQPASFADLWAAVWVASCLLPVGLAWLLTHHTLRQLPSSLFRQQIYIWWLSLSLLLLGSVLSLIQIPVADLSSPIWSQLGVGLQLLGAAAGTLALVRSQLPDLQPALRRLATDISAATILFGLALLLLWLTKRTIVGRAFTRSEPGIILAAAVFTVVFLLGWRLGPALAGLRLWTITRRQLRRLSDTPLETVLDPDEMSRAVLALVKRELGTQDVWLFSSEEGPGGRLILRPLAISARPAMIRSTDYASPERGTVRVIEPDTTVFAADSPFTRYLRQNRLPLIHHDLTVAGQFDQLSSAERTLLMTWDRTLYTPLHTGSRLVGVLALGEKGSGEGYDEHDFNVLQTLASVAAPPLAQARELAALRQVADHLFAENQKLVRHNQVLAAQTELYEQFMALISPELRRPLTTVDTTWNLIQEKLDEWMIYELTPAGSGRGPFEGKSLPATLIDRLNQAITESRTILDNLIATVPRVQNTGEMDMRQLNVDEICQDVIHALTPMAEARQVQIHYDSPSILPTVRGDARRLSEAVRYLLHNAIKFNKIGGLVRVECGVQGEELYIQVNDTGVGIPPERLDQLWDGFRTLNGTGKFVGYGLGMGLPLTRSIVRAHGGHIEAESKHGAGSRFSIYLPLNPDS